MNISKEIIKISAIVGAIFGFLALIPPFIFYACLTLFLFSSIATVLYYRKFDSYELVDYNNTALNGGIIGFVSFFGFAVLFIPCVLILSLIFKNYYNYGLPYFLNLQALWLFILILVTVGIICAVTNGVMLMSVQLVDSFRKVK